MSSENFYIAEYEKLKEEQLKRIEFRDHMIYLTLTAVGAVLGFVMSHSEYIEAFLILPLFCIVMGWTYYVNDTKISLIGIYIKDKLTPIFKAKDNSWESFRYSSKDRLFRKSFQLIIDILLFIGVSFFSIIYFLIKNFENSRLVYLVVILESISLIILLLVFIKKAYR